MVHQFFRDTTNSIDRQFISTLKIQWKHENSIIQTYFCLCMEPNLHVKIDKTKKINFQTAFWNIDFWSIENSMWSIIVLQLNCSKTSIL